MPVASGSGSRFWDHAGKVYLDFSSDVEGWLRSALPDGLIGHGDDRLDAVVSVLTVGQAKGLEFDDVVVVEPDLIDAEGARRGSDLYVALTRATRSLAIAYAGEYPRCLPATT